MSILFGVAFAAIGAPGPGYAQAQSPAQEQGPAPAPAATSQAAVPPSPARDEAQEPSAADAQNQPAPPSFAFRPVVEATLSRAIVPAHEEFAAAAKAERAVMTALCEAPGAGTLAAARAQFVILVAAFGGIEPYRIGPAIEANRFDRLLFWPDRRGRGQRQIEQLVAEGGVADPGALLQKSVAVQGLPALEYVLFASGADTVAAKEGGDRCRYGAAVASVIATVADELLAAWRGPFGVAVMTAGDDPASPYPSHGEVVKDLLGAGAELLQIDALKLGDSVLDPAGGGNPRLAPFWRSGTTAAMLIGNARSLSLLATPELEAALDVNSNMAREVRFEAAQVERALAPLVGVPLPDAAGDPAQRKRLLYAKGPLAALQRLFLQRVPAAFGFAAGFNARDRD